MMNDVFKFVMERLAGNLQSPDHRLPSLHRLDGGCSLDTLLWPYGNTPTKMHRPTHVPNYAFVNSLFNEFRQFPQTRRHNRWGDWRPCLKFVPVRRSGGERQREVHKPREFS